MTESLQLGGSFDFFWRGHEPLVSPVAGLELDLPENEVFDSGLEPGTSAVGSSTTTSGCSSMSVYTLSVKNFDYCYFSSSYNSWLLILVKKLIALMFTRKEKTVYVVGYSFKWLGLFRLSLWPFLVNFGRRSLSVMFWWAQFMTPYKTFYAKPVRILLVLPKAAQEK